VHSFESKRDSIKIVMENSDTDNIQTETATDKKLNLNSGVVFSAYLKEANERYGKLKTILYDKTRVPFYDFYVPNHIAMNFGHLWNNSTDKMFPLLKEEYQVVLNNIGFNERSLKENKRCRLVLEAMLEHH